MTHTRNGRKLRQLRCVVLLLGAAAATGQVQLRMNGAPPTFAQVLATHGIGTATPELLAALHHPDQEVRGVAAAELAELHVREALPEILYAAKAETDPTARNNELSAAAWMGSDEALTMLSATCQGAAVPPYIRQHAARTVFDQGRHTCFPAMAAMMRPAADTDTRIGAILLLTQLHTRTRAETDQVFALLMPALLDPDMRLRMEACEGVRFLGDARAIPGLRNALANEREPFLREQMQQTLSALESRDSSKP